MISRRDFIAVSIISISFLKAAVSEGENYCEKCTDVMTSLTRIFDKGPEVTNSLSQAICFGKKDCEQKISLYLLKARELMEKGSIDATVMCNVMNLCPQEKADLSAKFMLHILQTIDGMKNIQPSNLCSQKCEIAIHPVAYFFGRYEAELQEKIQRMCTGLIEVSMLARECKNRLNELLRMAGRFNGNPLCNLFCHERINVLYINYLQFQELLAEKDARAIQRNLDVAEVQKILRETKELFPNVITDSSNVNAFCTLCVTFVKKLPGYKIQLVEKMIEVVTDILYLKGSENVINLLRLKFKKWLTVVEEAIGDQEICMGNGLQACSEESYEKVVQKLINESNIIWRSALDEGITCGSCESFADFLAPILNKSATRKDLADYLYNEVVGILSVDIMDKIGLGIYAPIEKFVNFVAEFIMKNERQTCEEATFCHEDGRKSAEFYHPTNEGQS